MRESVIIQRLKLVILDKSTVNMSDRSIDLTIMLADLNEMENQPELTGHIDSILDKRKIKYWLLFVDEIA